MAIKVSQAFERTSANPIDVTLTLTKAQMKTVNDNLMPAYYFTIGQDDGQIYLYDKANTADPATGKFRVFEGGSGQTIQVDELPEASALLEDVILQYVGADDDPLVNGYFYQCVSDGEDPATYSWVQKDVQPSSDATLASAVTSNLAVGAIASGTTLAQGTTFTEFVQKLLITEIAPTFGFSITKSGNVAYGGSYTETLTLTVSNMGTAKSITKVEFYEGSTKVSTATESPYTYTMETATTDSTTFKAIVTYVKSNDASDTQTKTASINFYYNKFYGAVSDLAPSEATVEALTSALATGKGGTYSFTVTAGRICYAYPKSLGALSSIKDGNGFSLFDSFTRTEQTYTQNSTSVAYYRYVLTDPTTVSGYSVVFA